MKKHEELYNENKALIERLYVKSYKLNLRELRKENKLLQDRIDKAIEYIEKESWFMYKDNKLVIDRTLAEELLNILKGSDNND